MIEVLKRLFCESNCYGMIVKTSSMWQLKEVESPASLSGQTKVEKSHTLHVETED